VTRRTLVLVFAVALLVRGIVLWEVREAPFSQVLLGDAETFFAWAGEIAAGDWLGDEVFYQAPLYPYFLGLVRLFGGDVVTAKVVQALLGATSCVLVALASARLLGARTGTVAGLLAALYAPSIWLEGTLQKSALATLLTACTLFLLVRAIEEAEEPGRRLALGLGLALGLLALVRENALVLVPVALLWTLVAAERRRAALPLVLGVALVLVPVGARNAALGGAFLPTASNAGVNFYLGNGAAADGLYTPLIEGRGHARYEAEDARRLAEEKTGARLSPADVSVFWLERGLEDVSAAPLRWARLVAWKSALLLHRTEVMDAEAFEAYRAHSRLLDALGFLFHFGLLLPLATLGAFVVLRERDDVWPLLLSALVLGLGIALFFVAARFRLGLVPFLLPFAARGALALVEALRRRESRAALAPGIALAGLAALAANVPAGGWPYRLLGFQLRGDPVATTLSNVASSLLASGDASGAYAQASAALEHDSDDADATYNLAEAARRLGRDNEAIAAYEEAARLEPSYAAECLLQIGVVLATSGDLEGALLRFDAAVARDPGFARAHYNRAVALRQSQRASEAEAAYLTSIRLDPGFPDAHHNLAILRERQGRWEEALEGYEAAITADDAFQPALAQLVRAYAMHPAAELRDGARAVVLAHRLVALSDPPGWEALDLLAAALAETGDFDGARVTETRAARATEDPGLRAVLEERARNYESGLPRRLGS